jgi:hypothetical protein
MKQKSDAKNIENKSLLVALFIVCYGAVSIPAYWLRAASLAAFNALMALYVVYAVVTYILAVTFNMFIPHCMRTAGKKELVIASSSLQTFNDDTKTAVTDVNMLADGPNTTKPSTTRKYGFKMSIWGGIGNALGGILALVVTIILSQTLPGAASQCVFSFVFQMVS